MKNFIGKINLPILLLISYIIFIVLNKSANISDAIIILALSLLSGAKLYFDHVFVKKVDSKLSELEVKIDKDIHKVRKDFGTEVTTIKNDMSKFKISYNGGFSDITGKKPKGLF